MAVWRRCLCLRHKVDNITQEKYVKYIDVLDSYIFGQDYIYLIAIFKVKAFVGKLIMNRNLLLMVPRVKMALIRNNKFVLVRSTSTINTEDTVTHTGQKWDSDDYRMVRFMNTTKQVNPNWAIDLIAQVPPKEVTERVVWCDGGSGPEGHPRVYINLDKPGDHSCGYCGLRYVKKGHH